MRVYILWILSDLEPELYAVFSSKEKAEEFSHTIGIYCPHWIEEVVLDEVKNDS